MVRDYVSVFGGLVSVHELPKLLNYPRGLSPLSAIRHSDSASRPERIGCHCRVQAQASRQESQ